LQTIKLQFKGVNLAIHTATTMYLVISRFFFNNTVKIAFIFLQCEFRISSKRQLKQ